MTVGKIIRLRLLPTNRNNQLFLEVGAILFTRSRDVQPFEKMPNVFVGFLEKPFQRRHVERLAKPTRTREQNDVVAITIDELRDETRFVNLLEISLA